MNHKELNLIHTGSFMIAFLVIFVLAQSFTIHKLRGEVLFLKEVIVDLSHDIMLQRINQGEINED